MVHAHVHAIASVVPPWDRNQRRMMTTMLRVIGSYALRGVGKGHAFGSRLVPLGCPSIGARMINSDVGYSALPRTLLLR